MSEGSGRVEVERRLIEKSLQDDAFRQRLLEDPKGAVEQELGTRLPEDVRVVTVEESTDTIYLVLPGTPTARALRARTFGSRARVSGRRRSKAGEHTTQ